MDTGTIKNLSPHHNYSAIPTHFLTSDKLSSSAKGMLAFLLSLPKNHNIEKRDLPNYFAEGYYALSSTFDELVKKRFIHKIELRNKNGHFKGFEYRVYDVPTRKTETKKVIPRSKNRKSVQTPSVDELINQIYNENCLDTMSRMPDEFIDMVLTSPPYDGIRQYNGNNKFEFERIAVELTRILKDGGVIVWVIGDEVIRGSETGTAFKQALFFKENCGLRLHDTMIYEKNGTTFPAPKNGIRYTQIFEYMFILSKGKPITVNLITDKENRWAGWTNWGKKSFRDKNDELYQTPDNKTIPEYSPRTNIWKYVTGNGFMTTDKIAHQHPAIFPEKLAEDHILSWSNPNDIIFDPFAGSGTTLKIAKKLGRNFIASEINEKYIGIINSRLNFNQ